MTAKTSRSFRLSPEAIDALQRMADRQHKSQTEVIEGLILGTAQGESAQDAPRAEADRQLVAELRQHVADLQDEVRTLSDALRAAQESAKAAQTLHLMAATSTASSTDLSTTPATASSSPRPGLWARIRDAIRG